MSILESRTDHIRECFADETSSSVRVRLLRLSDYDHGFLQTLSALRPTEMSRAHFSDVFHSLGEHCRVWVAEVDGMVAATTTLLIERKFIHAGGIVGHVEDVAVNRASQGRGLGKVLMEHVIAEARAAGCYKVILECGEHVQAFYKRVGFRANEICMRIDLA